MVDRINLTEQFKYLDSLPAWDFDCLRKKPRTGLNKLCQRLIGIL
jgi:hypothetical protein